MNYLFFVPEEISQSGRAPALEIGRKYQLGNSVPVGAGGFGVVLKVNDQPGWPRNESAFALKMQNIGFPLETEGHSFNPAGDTWRAKQYRAFHLEWKTYLQADGAKGHVPLPYAFGIVYTEENAYYAILMEWIEGHELADAREILAGGTGILDARNTALLGIKVCEALKHLHDSNITHKDLNFDNVKVRFGNDPVRPTWAWLLDLGQSSAPNDIPTVGPKHRLAQVHFGAPEMFEPAGEGYSSERNDWTTDIWSLGAILYWLRTAERPLVGELQAFVQASDITQCRKIAQIKAQGLYLPSSCNLPGDDALRKAIARCTEYTPAERPNVKKVKDELEAITLNDPTPRPKMLEREVPEAKPPKKSKQKKRKNVIAAFVATTIFLLSATYVIIPSLAEMLKSKPSGISESSEKTTSVNATDDARALYNTASQFYAIRNYKEAARLYGLAADQGLAEAQNSLGWLYRDGLGVEQDDAEAARLIRLAADQGLADAQYGLGLLYYSGAGVEQDYAEAARLFGLAADQGHAEAQNSLGWLYRDGLGVEQDDAEAARLIRLAADQGLADAQYGLGLLYYSGAGVEQDYAEAARLFGLAADQGHENAQVKLDNMLAKGEAVE